MSESQRINFTKQDLAELSAPYSQADREAAMKLGFTRYLSEHGVSPSELERLMASLAMDHIQKNADVGTSTIDALSSVPKNIGNALGWYGALGLGVGGALGLGSGALRYHLERAAKGTDSDDVNAQRAKLNKYQKLKADIINNLSAEGYMKPQLTTNDQQDLEQAAKE